MVHLASKDIVLDRYKGAIRELVDDRGSADTYFETDAEVKHRNIPNSKLPARFGMTCQRCATWHMPGGHAH